MNDRRRDGQPGFAEKRSNVLIAAAFPPPLHGASAISESIAADLAKIADVRCRDLSSRSQARSAKYHLGRISSVMKGVFSVLRNAFRAKPCLYIPADGGLGLFYTLLLTSVARVSGHAIFIHHHSFSAIDRRSSLMSALVAVAGQHASHVFLCQKMQRRFREKYPGNWRALVSSNAAHLQQADETSSEGGASIRIGLLSNLTRDKGLHVFLDVLRACLDQGVPVQGRLAGPIADEEDQVAVARALAELKDHLTYLGPQYGSDKDRFLSDIDVFVFPTTYANEAQPNVVFEAISAGAALIVFGRGCLDEDVGGECGLVIPVSHDFVSAACSQIARWHQDRSLLVSARAAARQRFVSLRGSAQRDYQALLGAIAGQSSAD